MQSTSTRISEAVKLIDHEIELNDGYQVKVIAVKVTKKRILLEVEENVEGEHIYYEVDYGNDVVGPISYPSDDGCYQTKPDNFLPLPEESKQPLLPMNGVSGGSGTKSKTRTPESSNIYSSRPQEKKFFFASPMSKIL